MSGIAAGSDRSMAIRRRAMPELYAGFRDAKSTRLILTPMMYLDMCLLILSCNSQGAIVKVNEDNTESRRARSGAQSEALSPLSISVLSIR